MTYHLLLVSFNTRRRLARSLAPHTSNPNQANPLNDQTNDLSPAASALPSSPPSSSPAQAPDFTHVRRQLRTAQQREALGQFIKASWTPAELAEYARSMYLAPGKTKPTAASYRFVLEWGPDHEWAKEALATMRAPGYVMPPFDRPEPKDYEWDDPDNPEYSAEVRSAAYTLARGCMNAYDDRLRRPRRGPETPIRRGLLRKCFRDLYDANAFGLRSGTR